MNVRIISVSLRPEDHKALRRMARKYSKGNLSRLLATLARLHGTKAALKNQSLATLLSEASQ